MKKEEKPVETVQTVDLSEIIGAARMPVANTGTVKPKAAPPDVEMPTPTEKKQKKSAEKHIPDDVDALSSMVAALISKAKEQNAAAQNSTGRTSVVHSKVKPVFTPPLNADTADLAIQRGTVGAFEEVFRQNNSLLGEDEQFISTDHLALHRKAKSGRRYRKLWR